MISYKTSELVIHIVGKNQVSNSGTNTLMIIILITYKYLSHNWTLMAQQYGATIQNLADIQACETFTFKCNYDNGDG